MPKVSIIVPVYNVSEYLSKCLSSLVAQSLEDIEILIVNDGSTDNSGEIARQYAEKYPNMIRFFEKKNGGLSDARNFGIEHATGEFLAFVDSDDYVSPNMMQDMYTLAQTHHADMVICNLQKVNEREEITQKLTQLPNFPLAFALKDRSDAFSDMSYFACNKLFRRCLFEKERFTKGIHFEDIELIPRILLKCNTITRTDAYHYQYFERSNSISKSHTIKGLDMLKAVEKVEKTYRRMGMPLGEKALKDFMILEGYFSFIPYLAFVKDDEVYQKMKCELQSFLSKNDISKIDILRYHRFGKNYILSLPLKKQLYYLFHLAGCDALVRKLHKKG